MEKQEFQEIVRGLSEIGVIPDGDPVNVLDFLRKFNVELNKALTIADYSQSIGVNPSSIIEDMKGESSIFSNALKFIGDVKLTSEEEDQVKNMLYRAAEQELGDCWFYAEEFGGFLLIKVKDKQGISYYVTKDYIVYDD